jgi:ABC-type uncharacterized transport system permease subunit
MKTLSIFLGYALPVLYLAMVIVYYMIYSGRKRYVVRNTTPFLAILVLIHALEIISRHIVFKTIPLSNLHDSLDFLAFSIAIVYLVIEMTVKNRGSGLFILGLAFVIELISSFNLSYEPETNELLTNPIFAIHASLSIMGYTAMALSAIYALMYIVQNNNLKKRKIGKLFTELPAITYLQKMSTRSVFIGIILLGIGLLLGHIQALELMGSFWPKDMKVIVSDAIWILYLMGYIMLLRNKWRGEKMAYYTISGFLILIAGGLLVIYLSESFHNFF